MYDMKRLYLPKKGRSKRVSSCDKTGKNDDYITINPYETINIAEIKGPGIINHIWMTIATDEKYSFRKVLIRAYWDGEEEPSVNAVSYTHLRAHETVLDLVCRLLLEKKKQNNNNEDKVIWTPETTTSKRFRRATARCTK